MAIKVELEFANRKSAVKLTNMLSEALDYMIDQYGKAPEAEEGIDLMEWLLKEIEEQI